MRFCIVVFPGSNCDQDCGYVTEQVLGEATQFIWHQESILPDCDVVIIPGGFSYGDYLRVGAIARYSPIMKAVTAFAKKGGYVLGICNGFQILVEAGLLPGVLLQNRSTKFICKWQFLRVESKQSAFTAHYENEAIISLPIAHAEGNYILDPAPLSSLKENDQILFRYVTEHGELSPEANPNGSIENIAGVCNAAGNVLGMMPHPERAADPVLGGTDGLKLFQSLCETIVKKNGRSQTK